MVEISAKSVGDHVNFDGAFVTLKRTGLSRGIVGKGEKRIPVGSISAVQWKPAGLLPGVMSFSMAGSNEVRSRFGRQSWDGMQDENSVSFGKRDEPDFVAVRDAIEQAIADRMNPQAAVVQEASAADELAKFAALRDQGILTEEEFAAKKAAILGL